jgi:prepilin-type N-terminal cleavage/methylation domain-containing protein
MNTTMRLNGLPLRNQKGLSLLEIIVVLSIMAILAAVAVPRFISMESNAKKRSIDVGIQELNSLEHLTWADQKLSASGYIDDANIYSAIIFDMGTDYTWNAGDPTPSGGTIFFKGESVTVSRIASTNQQPAIWKKSP